MGQHEPLWVFGYGSLMWRPGFPHRRSLRGLLTGAHRRLCVYSWVHRGTQERPGLVLGLDRGGACRGLAFEVAPDDSERVVTYLREREQVTMVYLERTRSVRLETGETVNALCYMVDTDHPQYAGRIDRDHMLETVTGAVGQSGENWEYVVNSAAAIRSLGLHDPDLEWLSDQLMDARA